MTAPASSGPSEAPAPAPAPEPPGKDGTRRSWGERFAAAAREPWLLPALFLLQLAETFIPFLPYEAVFAALCLVAPRRIPVYLAVTLAGTLAAASILYAAGAGLLSGWAGEATGMSGAMAERLREEGGWLIVLGAVTPVPSQLVNLAAGATGYPFPAFLAWFGAGRLFRFSLFALLMWKFGPAMEEAWKESPRSSKIIGVGIGLALMLWLLFRG